MMVRPKFAIKGYRFLPSSDEKQLSMRALMDSMILNKGETAVLMSDLYVGPQRSDVLKRYDMNFEKIHVYFRAEFFDAIAKIIEDLVKLMYKFSSNWGVSIILVSFLIYFSMYPLTMKSMLSMQKMQGLQPKIAELRTKHEKNPQKLNQEIMKLYGENKVNPMGGCLPLLLQMPVFICLYQMIWRSVLFKGAGFLWIKDLSEPDRLIILKKSFPIIGNEINVFPVIILILMVIQQKMTAKNMNVTDPNQLAQQKMMAFMMPIMLLLVFYRIASGLTLYLTVFYILSSFTQWRVAKKVKAVK
jgi:YidC/Oxa1 family membrane protein insertase